MYLLEMVPINSGDVYFPRICRLVRMLFLSERTDSSGKNVSSLFELNSLGNIFILSHLLFKFIDPVKENGMSFVSPWVV